MDKEIDINDVLKHLKEIIGSQAVDIAVLKAQADKLKDN